MNARADSVKECIFQNVCSVKYLAAVVRGICSTETTWVSWPTQHLISSLGSSITVLYSCTDFPLFFPCSATTSRIEDQSAECDYQQQQQPRHLMLLLLLRPTTCHIACFIKFVFDWCQNTEISSTTAVVSRIVSKWKAPHVFHSKFLHLSTLAKWKHMKFGVVVAGY